MRQQLSRYKVLSTRLNENYWPISFGKYMILPINHIANWRYIRQQKQEQIEKYAIHKKTTRIDYDYNIGDSVMVRRNQAYKYETPFKGAYESIQTWTNGTVTTQMCAVTVRLNIHCLKTYDNTEVY